MRVVMMRGLGIWLLLLVREAGGLKCYECLGRECKSGFCEGYWCKRSSVVDDGVRKYRYACEDDPAIPPGCMDIEVFGYTMQTCFCDESDHCTARFDAMDLLEPPPTAPPLDIRPVTCMLGGPLHRPLRRHGPPRAPAHCAPARHSTRHMYVGRTTAPPASTPWTSSSPRPLRPRSTFDPSPVCWEDHCTARFDAMDLLEPPPTAPPLDIRPVTSPSVGAEASESSSRLTQLAVALLTIPTLLYLGYRRYNSRLRKRTTSPRPHTLTKIKLKHRKQKPSDPVL